MTYGLAAQLQKNWRHAATHRRTTGEVHGPVERPAKTGGHEHRQRRYAGVSHPGHRFSVGVSQRRRWSASRHGGERASREKRWQQRQPRPRSPSAGRKRAPLPGGVPVDEIADYGRAHCHPGGRQIMSLFSALSVGASGMAAQRARAELLVENLANAETTRTPEGGPYRRKDAVFESTTVSSPFASVFSSQLESVGGVAVSDVVTDMSDPERRYLDRKSTRLNSSHL